MLLARTAKTQVQIAARIGCSQAVVAYWLSGARKPSPEYRMPLKRAYRIPIEAWDQIIAKPTAVKKSAPPAPASPPEPEADAASIAEFSVRARALRLDATIQAKLELIEHDSSVTPLEWFKCVQTALAQLERLGKLTGQTQEVNEAKILRLPAWSRIQEALIRVLADWPDALRKVGEELQRMGSES